MTKGSVTNDIVLLSCERVEELRDLILAVKQSLKSAKPSLLLDTGKRLQRLQKEIKGNDLALDTLLMTGVTLSTEEMAILEKKKALQLEILHINSSLVTEVKNIKSTLAGEMATLKQGRTALKGYGNNAHIGGRVIKRSM